MPSPSALALLLLLAATPRLAWGVACRATPSDIEGPYYQGAGVPVFNKKASNFCLPGPGNSTAFTLSGKVYGLPSCKKALNGKSKKVVVQVWQANNEGDYDDSRDSKDTNCRATVRVGSDGKFTISTLRPARYGSPSCTRAPHIHFKVSAKGYKSLTTQLYFADDFSPDCGCGSACRASDAALHVKVDKRGRGKFNFVLAR